MEPFSVIEFGRTGAELYDELFSEPLQEGELAYIQRYTPRSLLEVGLGTGRVAIPLAAAGVAVTGVEVSSSFISKFTHLYPTTNVRIVHGDATQSLPSGPFDSITCLINTFLTLGPPAGQLKALSNMADSLAPGGSVILEVFNPNPETLGTIETSFLSTKVLKVDKVVLQATLIDRVKQLINFQNIVISNGAVNLNPVSMYYLDAFQLDALAHAAGLVLADRYSRWDCAPFTYNSSNMISRYQRI